MFLTDKILVQPRGSFHSDYDVKSPYKTDHKIVTDGTQNKKCKVDFKSASKSPKLNQKCKHKSKVKSKVQAKVQS